MTVANGGGAPTISEARDAETDALKASAAEDPTVAAILSACPGASIGAIRTAAEIASETAETALPEVEDEWDPFEEN